MNIQTISLSQAQREALHNILAHIKTQEREGVIVETFGLILEEYEDNGDDIEELKINVVYSL
jgi:hypothetical protein